MAAPSVQATLDRTAYAPGDLMTLTVTYGDPDSRTLQLTIKVEDSTGGTGATVVTSAVLDALTLSVSDSDTSRVWTKRSDTGTIAVFTAKA